MTIVGDVHYYVVKAKVELQKPVKEKLRTPLFNFFYTKSESESSTRTKSIIKKLQEKAKTSDEVTVPAVLPYFNREHNGPLRIIVRPEVYEHEMKSQRVEQKRKSFDDAYAEPVKITPKGHQRYKNIRSLNYANNNPLGLSIKDWLTTKMSPTEIVPAKSPQKRKPKEPTIKVTNYNAHYFASDDDFLMFAHVRKFFKKNALESDDSILFAIQDTLASGEDAVDHPTLDNLAFLMETQVEFKFSTRLKLFTILYAIASFFIVRFVGNYNIN
jgi:hypothetical protein